MSEQVKHSVQLYRRRQPPSLQLLGIAAFELPGGIEAYAVRRSRPYSLARRAMRRAGALGTPVVWSDVRLAAAPRFAHACGRKQLQCFLGFRV